MTNKHEYTITDGRKIKQCPKCKRCKIGASDKCLCGFEWSKQKLKIREIKKPRNHIPTSVSYVAIPALTPEDREKSTRAMAIEIKKMIEENPITEKIVAAILKRGVPLYPELFSESRWDKYRAMDVANETEKTEDTEKTDRDCEKPEEDRSYEANGTG